MTPFVSRAFSIRRAPDYVAHQTTQKAESEKNFRAGTRSLPRT